MHDTLNAPWPRPAADADADLALARAHAPILIGTADEPYPPLVYGYSVFRASAPSPSSKFVIEPKAALTIEYAVWYDYDIGHFYDLEHVWVDVDAAGAIVRVEASRHGKRLDMDGCALVDGHPVLAIETGKHAHWPSPEAMAPAYNFIRIACDRLAGVEGVHMGNRFAEGGLYTVTPSERRVARLKLCADRRTPDFTRWQRFEPALIQLVPWPHLAAWIPGRMRHLIDAAVATVPHLKAIFLDCGDTLADEASEVKIPGTEIVTAAHLVPGARALMEALRARGYPLVLVADGPRATFVNILQGHGLWGDFQAHVISEDIGALKPDARMFDTALAAIGLTRADAGRVVMIGNNLTRDIAGANRLGIISVFMGWSQRRTHVPETADEVPDYSVMRLDGLAALIDQIEQGLAVVD